MDIDSLTMREFRQLPLVAEGESKEVRYCGNGRVVIRLKPTIYSYTHNRAGIIPGSDILRLKSIRALLPVLRAAGISHSYLKVNDRWILSELVIQPVTGQQAMLFRPSDLSAGQIAMLPVAPPVEVVVKRVHSGTPKHRYYGLDRWAARISHPSFPGASLVVDKPYPETFVRFDWRNPLTDGEGRRLADEVLPEPMADWFIDSLEARKTALRAFTALDKYLRRRGMELWDICFFISEDGKVMFGEVSPDCLRVRAQGGTALDKDVWRAGGSSGRVLEKWRKFTEIIREETP